MMDIGPAGNELVSRNGIALFRWCTCQSSGVARTGVSRGPVRYSGQAVVMGTGQIKISVPLARVSVPHQRAAAPDTLAGLRELPRAACRTTWRDADGNRSRPSGSGWR
jgi:hypothetical protein